MLGDKESVLNGSETSSIGSDSGFSIIVSMTGGSSLGAILPVSYTHLTLPTKA